MCGQSDMIKSHLGPASPAWMQAGLVFSDVWREMWAGGVQEGPRRECTVGPQLHIFILGPGVWGGPCWESMLQMHLPVCFRTTRDQARSMKRKWGKWGKKKMTAVAYGERRGYEKRKKLDGRAHSRNSRRLPCPALGLAAVSPSWVNSFHQL